MNVDTFNGYSKALEMIEAQEQLKAFQVTEYPNLKLKDKRKLYKKYSKAAYPKDMVKKKVVSMEEAMRLMSGGK